MTRTLRDEIQTVARLSTTMDDQSKHHDDVQRQLLVNAGRTMENAKQKLDVALANAKAEMKKWQDAYGTDKEHQYGNFTSDNEDNFEDVNLLFKWDHDLQNTRARQFNKSKANLDKYDSIEALLEEAEKFGSVSWPGCPAAIVKESQLGDDGLDGL